MEVHRLTSPTVIANFWKDSTIAPSSFITALCSFLSVGHVVDTISFAPLLIVARQKVPTPRTKNLGCRRERQCSLLLLASLQQSRAARLDYQSAKRRRLIQNLPHLNLLQ